MGARQKLWAKRARIRLILTLGSKCNVCHARNNLTFDCIVAQGAAHHAMESSGRMSFYKKQARAGNLALLCAECNSIKSHHAPEVWRSALSFIAESERILRLACSPGRGTTLTPVEKRDCLKAACSRARANRETTVQL